MRYEVIRPWQGVQIGDVLELATVHPSLVSHVRPIVSQPGAELEPATPAAASSGAPEAAEPNEAGKQEPPKKRGPKPKAVLEAAEPNEAA